MFNDNRLVVMLNQSQDFCQTKAWNQQSNMWSRNSLILMPGQTQLITMYVTIDFDMTI